MTTTFFSFNNKDNADKFIGALLDHGATSEDISVIARDKGGVQCAAELQKHAETGITTTTAADFAKGAMAGTGVGLGLGVAAGLAALLIPGFGLVLGGGALATAIAGAAATTAGLALAGGIAGFMRDLGIEGEVPDEFERDYAADHVIVAVNSHIDGVGLDDLEGLGDKYHATRTTLDQQVVAAVPVDVEIVKKPIVDPSTGERELTTVEIRQPEGASQIEMIPVPPVVPIPGTPQVQPVMQASPPLAEVIEPVQSKTTITTNSQGTVTEEVLEQRVPGARTESVEVRPAISTTNETIVERKILTDSEGNSVKETVSQIPFDAPRGDVFVEKTTVQQPGTLHHTETRTVSDEGGERTETTIIESPEEARTVSRVTVNPVTGVTEREIIDETVPMAEDFEEVDADPANRFYKA